MHSLSPVTGIPTAKIFLELLLSLSCQLMHPLCHEWTKHVLFLKLGKIDQKNHCCGLSKLARYDLERLEWLA